MADTKISALTALTGAGTASDDLLVIVDTGATQTKKITVAEFQAAPISAGTANGILYLNGSKVATSGSGLTFDGWLTATYASAGFGELALQARYSGAFSTVGLGQGSDGTAYLINNHNASLAFGVNNAEQMRLTATGLGIGTSSPSQRLAVIDNNTYQARAATATGNYTSGGMVFGGFGTDADDPNYYGSVGYDHSTGYTYIKNKYYSAGKGIVFQVAAAGAFTDAMLLTTSGNLGLGVTPSGWNSTRKVLQIGQSTALYSFSTFQSILGTNVYMDSGGTDRYINSNIATQYVQSGGVHSWNIAPSGTAGDPISFTQAMTLDANGSWQLGTTTAISSGGATICYDGATYNTLSLADSRAFALGVGPLIMFAGKYNTAGAVYANFAYIQGIKENATDGNNAGALVIATAPNGTGTAERARFDSLGNFIHQVNATAPTLSTNGTMSFELTSDTSLKIVVRGSDGVTRSASLTLA